MQTFVKGEPWLASAFFYIRIIADKWKAVNVLRKVLCTHFKPILVDGNIGILLTPISCKKVPITQGFFALKCVHCQRVSRI